VKKKILAVIFSFIFLITGLGVVGYVVADETITVSGEQYARRGHHRRQRQHRRRRNYPRHRRSGPQGPPCFIATASCGENSTEVAVLREFRNKWLMTSDAGREFVAGYYKVSPKIAKVISEDKRLRLIVSTTLLPLVGGAYLMNEMK